jgi:sulfate transport system permease protein
LTAIYAPNGWLGRPLDGYGIKVAYTPLGVTIALIFIGPPFVARTLQPVIEDLDPEVEEAATSLGASRFHVVVRVILPYLLPAWLTGFALAFARAVGDMVRCVHFRQHADADRDPSATHHEAGTVRLRGRHGDRSRHADDVIPAAPGDQRLAALEWPQSQLNIWLVPFNSGFDGAPRASPFVGAGMVALASHRRRAGLPRDFPVLLLALVFTEAFSNGWASYAAAIRNPDAIAALELTLLAAGIAVPANLAFGICAGWTIAKFEFPGRNLLTTPIDLPFAVSPVISGMVFVLLFGRQGLLGPWMLDHGLKVVFAVPGIILATVFVSFPFVAREIIPVMEAAGTEEEEAARVLGASGLQIFLRVTLPNIKGAALRRHPLHARWVVRCRLVVRARYEAYEHAAAPRRDSYNEHAFQAAFAVSSPPYLRSSRWP